MSRRVFWIGALVAVLTACGDSGAPTTSPPAPATSTTAAPPAPATTPPPVPATTTPSTADPADLSAVESFVITDRSHSEGTVEYSQDPPVGGQHAPIWQECGFYEEPIRNENGVHTLEHGAVWLTYRPDLPAAEVDTLRRLAREPKLLVSPYPGLDSAVVASAWGRQLRVPSADDPRLEAFIATYLDAPDSPEPGAPCFDGRGVGA